MATPIYSLSISARLTLDMHSLNNEGGEGNQIQTRMVDIVAADGRLYNVNAISGDMLKHIQAEHLYHIARNRSLALCAACQLFDANRISADSEYISQIQGKSDGEAIDLMLQRCTLDDVEGNLITADRSTPRKSVAEFGWVVGVPVDGEGRELTTTGSYLHVKYATERGASARAAASSEEARKANLGQALFHRPASSGVYALVTHYEISRIGFNDITRRYTLNESARLARHRALLESVLYTFLQPNGAMRSAQLPHLVAAEGAVSYSTDVVPAPTVSPLNAAYEQEIQEIAAALNGLRPGAVVVRSFASLSALAGILREMVETTAPFRMTV
ncbi:MAG: DevR family CRISPR-associated autoregulator [Anaerolineae bacterium]|nr:DevR family CRISPR-associated autoregulator [Anaerolineae bacterium]